MAVKLGVSVLLALSVLSVPSPAGEAAAETKGADAPVLLSIQASWEILKGRGGFGIDSPPYRSRLDFPLGGNGYAIRAALTPFTNGRWTFHAEAGFMPDVTGATEDTDWILSSKWLYSRSRTDGSSLRFRIGGMWNALTGSPFTFSLGASLFSQRDIFTMTDLRQTDLFAATPEERYVEVGGDVGRYEERITALSVDVEARMDLGWGFAVTARGRLLPVGIVTGSGNWLLRQYRFQQVGLSIFSSFDVEFRLSLRLLPALSISLGVIRQEWGAKDLGEDGQYARTPEYNYENMGIVEFIRHLQYGLVLSAELRL